MQTELQAINKERDSLVMRAQSLRVNSPDSLQEAVRFTSDVKEAWKRTEQTRKFFVDPLNKQIKEINAKFKPFLETLERTELEAKRLMGAYAAECENRRAAEEDRLRKIQEANYLKQVKKAEKKDEPPPPPPPPITVEAPKTEGLQIRKVWDFEIADETKIPREYLCVDEKKSARWYPPECARSLV